MIARSVRPRARRSKPRRVSVNRDKTFLKFLAAEGICILKLRVGHKCDGPIDPCHGKPNGMGSKGPDNEALPMCRAAHNEQTRLGWVSFCRKWNFDRAREVQIWQSLYLIWKESSSWPQPVS